MSKIKSFSIATAIFCVIATSLLASPPTLKQYGWDDEMTQIVTDQQEQISGGLWTDFTHYRDLVLLEEVIYTCDLYPGKRCLVLFSSIEELDNVRFTNDPDGIHRTIRVKESLTSNPSYVDITPDNMILVYEED